MDRRHKALVVATTLLVVLSIVGFVFVADALAHVSSTTNIRSADDASDVSVAYSYSFDGHNVMLTKDDAPLGPGHDDNELAIEGSSSGLVAAEGYGDWIGDDASGGASGYDDEEEYSYEDNDEYDEDDASSSEVGSDSGDDDDSVELTDSAQQQAQQQTQQEQTQQQTPQQQTQQQQQSGKLLVRKRSKVVAKGSITWPGQPTRCGVDRNVLKSCSKPTTNTELVLYRAGRATARLEHSNYECSGVLLGDSPTNIYLLASADCVETRERAYVTFHECPAATEYAYGHMHSLYHANRELGYAIIKINSTNTQSIGSIASYAQLSRHGAEIGTVVIVPSYTFAYGRSIATTYELKPITIQKYEPTQDQGKCFNTSDPAGLVTYKAHSMDHQSYGSPVFSASNGSIVALHLCGGCHTNSTNTALSSKSIVEDLEAKGLLRSEFVAA